MIFTSRLWCILVVDGYFGDTLAFVGTGIGLFLAVGWVGEVEVSAMTG